MTFHAGGCKWKYGDPVDEITDLMVMMLDHNRMGNMFTPPCFAVLNAADNAYCALASLFTKWDFKKPIEEHVKDVFPKEEKTVEQQYVTFEDGKSVTKTREEKTGPAPDWFIELAQKVAPKIKLYEVREFKIPTSFTVPKINKKYPRL